MLPFSDVNLLAVLASTVAVMVLGMLWYSPMCLGTAWLKLVKLDPESMQGGMKRSMSIAICGNLIQAYALGLILLLVGPSSLQGALILGIVLFFALVIPSELSGIAWEKRPVKLMYINAGWILVSVLVMTTILYLWP